jgi:hypothetical protein
MRLRIISFAAVALLAACSASPTAVATPSGHRADQSNYVGPGSGGDQRP